MANEIDFVTLLVPTIISAIITFILIGIKKFTRTEEGTLTGAIKLERVQTDMASVENRMTRAFDRIETMINQKEKDDTQAIQALEKRVEELSTNLRVHDYRLDMYSRELERLRQSNRNGGDKAPI